MADVYEDLLGGAQRVTDDYEALIDANQAAERQQIEGSLAVGSRSEPDRTAKVVQMAERTGLPRDTVDRNLEVLQKPRVDYEALIRDAPVTADFLSNVDNASVAHDAVDELKGFEWLVKSAGLGVKQGQAPIELGGLGMKAMTQGLTDADERRITELEQLMAAPTGADGFFQKAYVGTFKTGPQVLGALGAGVKMGLPAAMAAGGAAAIAGQAGPQIAIPEELVTVPIFTMAGLSAGMAGGAGKFSYELEAGNAFLEYRAIQDVDGKPLDPRVAAIAAQAVGTVNAAVELVGLAVLAKSIPGGDRLLGAFTRQGVRDVLQRPTVQRALGMLVARFGGVWTAEVAQEVVQEGILIIGGELAKAGAEGEFAPVEGVGERLGQTAVQAAEEFAVISAIGPGSTFVMDAARAKRAKDNQRVFEAVGSTESKVRERVPERFREFVAKATKDGPADTVYIPAERFVEYFQSAGIEPAEVLKFMPEVAAQLEERLAAGGDLAIPMGDFATYLAPSPHYKGLSADLRLRPDDMTLREATEWEAQQEQLTKEAKGEAGEQATPEDPIYQDVLDQLKGTGMEAGAAEKNATLTASVFNTLAKRTGQKPDELYARYKLKIQRGQQYGAEEIVRDDAALDETLDKIRAGRPAGGILSEVEAEETASAEPARAAVETPQVPETVEGAPRAQIPSAPPAARRESALGKGIGGAENRVRINDKWVPGQWVVMDAAELAPSIDKAENQYRDRNRAAAQAQVRQIAGGIEFDLLGDSPMMDYGAPTLSRDGRVLGGNGRLAAIRMAYDTGTGERYRQPMIDQAAQFGLDPQEIEGMERPVLVRVLTEDVDIREAAIASNEGGALRMSALEQAKVDAERIGEVADFETDADGNLSIPRSRAGIRKWIGKQPATQRGALVDADGNLSAEGFSRLRNALLYRAYGDSPTLARLVEAVDPGARNIAAALMRVAPKMAELRQGIETGDRYDLDISADLQSAVETLNRVKESGQSLDEFLRQGDIFGEQLTGPAGALVRFLGANLRSSRVMAEGLDRYLELAEQAGSPKQADLMGGTAPSKESLLERAAGSAKVAEFEIRPSARSQTSLFQEAAPKPWQQYLEEWTPEPSLSPEHKAIERRFMEWILADPERAVREYNKLKDAEGGKVISADVARELSPDYLADRTISAAVQEPASALTKALYARRLAEPPGPGERRLVLFSAGGMGAGKTSGIKRFLVKEEASAHIIFDSNMGQFGSGMKKINQAYAAEHEVLIVYTHRELENALRGGFLARAARQEAKFGTGRTAPLDVFLQTHLSANRATDEFAAALADDPRASFLYIINEADRSKSRMAEFAEVPVFADFEYNSVRERLVEIVEEEYRAGRISAKIRRATLDSQAPDGGQKAGAGDRRQPAPQRGRRTQRQVGPDELISQALERAGIDIRLVSNEEARKALRDLGPAAFEQGAAPQSEAFKQWFGDSKVVDENGEPLVVYHATSGSFDQFEAPAYFTDSADFAEAFGGQTPNVMPVYLRIEKPLLLDGAVEGRHFEWDADDVQDMKAQGHDGVIISTAGRDTIYTIFDAEQVKSAIGNRGTFDSTPNILHQSAYHGSPYDFDRFSLEHIGSGEGAQAYGWGLYFAEEERVADGYAKSVQNPNLLAAANAEMSRLAEIMEADRVPGTMRDFRTDEGRTAAKRYDDLMASKFAVGQVYQVEIDDSATRRMLIGDEVLAKQPQAFRAIKKLLPRAKGNWTGFDAYDSIEAKLDRLLEEGAGESAAQWLASIGLDIEVASQAGRVKASDQITSEALAALGIPGIKYKDANSRRVRVRWSDTADRSKYGYDVEAIARHVMGDMSTPELGMAELRRAAVQNNPYYSNPEVFQAAITAIEAGDVVIEKGTHNLVVFDESVIEITAKNGKPVSKAQRAELMQDWTTYDGEREAGAPDPQKPGKGSRGVTQIGFDRAMTIKLFDKADLSTFLHEGGHLYLELLKDAAVQNVAAREDFETFLTWAGFEGGFDAWLKATPDEQRVHHEKFARGFETYLMEGKAPSLNLQRVFARFRAWLVSIYRQAKALNAELSDPVRRVMDRLVATDEEIAAAQEQQNYEPLFSDAEAAGQSPTEFEAYRKAILEAKREAEAVLTSAVLRDITREETAWWKEERQKIEDAVTAEAHAMPVYRALAFLQRGTKPDGEAMEGVEPVKLNKAALVDQYGEGFLKNLPRPYVYSREGGVAPDVVAPMFGFDSGDAMIRELIAAQPMKAYIAKATQERMRAKHGDIMLDGRMAEKAMDAVHNEKRADLLAAELAALQRLRLPAESPIGAVPPSGERRLITEAARRAIAGRRLRMIRPYEFRIHEATASRAAFEAARKGDYNEAYTQKRRQLLNHELYRAATEARDKAEQIRDYMREFDKRGRRQAIGKAGKDYLEQIDAIRERFDFRRISGPQAQKRLALAAWIDSQRAQGMEVKLPAWLMDEARRTPYMELTFEELLGVHDTVVNIAHLARLRHKLLASRKDADFHEVVTEVAAAIQAHHRLDKSDFEFAPKLKKKIKQGMARAAAEHTKMEFLFDFLDGEKPLGPVWTALFKPLADAENAEQQMQADARTRIQEIFTAYSAAERRQMFTRKFHAPEIDQSVNKATLLAIALNVGNQYNREVLKLGYRWSDGQLAALLTRLDERDWRTVQAIWDYLDSYWPQIKQLQRDLTGLVPEKVEAVPFTAPTGQAMRGGYYPIAYDSRLSWRQKELDAESAITDLYGGAYSRVMTRHGHTIERTNSGGKAVKVDLSVMTNHVVNVIHDLTHRRAILDVDRLVTADAVREAIQGAAGKAMYDQLRPWLKSIASDYKPHLTVVEGALNHLRAGATVVSMGWKITTALVQPLGYTHSIELLGPKYAGIGLREVYGKGHPIRSIANAKEFAFERSEQIKNRMHTFDRDVREHFKHLTETEKSAPIRRSFFYLTGGLDMSVSLPTWMGAYRKAMDGEAEGIERGDEFAAIDYADSILRRSQSAGGAKDLAAVQAGHPVLKLFTTFYSYFNVLFNLFQRAHWRTDYTKPRDMARFTASMFLLWFVPAILSEIIAGRGPDDDEEWGEYMKRTAATWALYPLQSMVFLRDLANVWGPYGYDGPPALDALESTGRALAIPVKALDDEQEISRSDIKAVLDATGYWFHLPTRQIYITGSYLYDWATGIESPESIGEVAEGLAFSRPAR